MSKKEIRNARGPSLKSRTEKDQTSGQRNEGNKELPAKKQANYKPEQVKEITRNSHSSRKKEVFEQLRRSPITKNLTPTVDKKEVFEQLRCNPKTQNLTPTVDKKEVFE